MAYINDLSPDRFSLDYILKENCYDKDSVLVSNEFLMSLTETEKMSLADMMGGRTAKHSARKLKTLNKKKAFFDIPETRGDIKKSKAYKDVKMGLLGIKNLVERGKGKNNVEAVQGFQVCTAALENLEKNTRYFEKAYKDNDSANILAYQTIAAAVFEFTTILLINCTTFNEDNKPIYSDPPKNSLAKNILYKNLNKFNDICRNNKLKLNEEFEAKVEEFNMVHQEAALAASGLGTGIAALGSKLGAVGSAVAGAVTASTPLAIGLGVAAIASSIIALVYLSRTLICYFYFKKTELAESLEYVGGMVEANSMQVKNGNPKDSRKVSEKQKNLATKLRNLGKKLDDDNKQAQFNSVAIMKKEDMETNKSIEDKLNPDNRTDVTSNNLNNPDDELFI